MPQTPSSRGIFDPLCGDLEDFFNGHASDVLRNRAEEWRFVVAPLEPYYGKRLRGKAAFAVLGEAFKGAERRFAEICRGHGLDDWLAVLRRAPDYAMGGSNNRPTYLTLGLVKYSDPALDTTGGTFIRGSQYAMVHTWTDELLFKADRLGALARAMDDIAGVMRWIGKGADFAPTQEYPLRFEPDAEVYAAVSQYEERRPKSFFRDQGLITQDQAGKGAMFFGLGGFKGPIWMYIPVRDMSLNVNYFPFFFEWEPVGRVLEHYREAIEDLFNVRLEAVAVFLGGLFGRVWSTLLWPEAVKEEESPFLRLTLTLPKDDSSPEFQHRLEFTFRLLRTGYLRFPRDHWVDTFAKVQMPWAPMEAERRDLLEEFFDAFSLVPAKRQDINLSVLRPYPLLFQAPSGEFYLDMRGVKDFLRDLIEAAKEWYSSQHGDRFTLILKTMVEKAITNVKIWHKIKVRSHSGRKVECDLIILTGSTLFVVECKAHAKSPAFFRGDPSAVQQRSSLLNKDFQQAKQAAFAVEFEMHQPGSRIPVARQVELCVCTPSQEYLRPIDRFGWLAEGVPRICTPEELIGVLQKAAGGESSSG